MDLSTFAIDLDDRPMSLKKKLAEAKSKRYGVIIVVGKKDAEKGETVTVDFSAVQDKKGVLEGVFKDDDLGKPNAVDVKPLLLREVLLNLERAYA
jgi:threonyl-tRNA synthetase